MEKRIINFIKTQWLAIWIIITAASLVTIIACAEALVTLSPMKRVVVSKDGHGILFSSNILMVMDFDADKNNSIATYHPIYRTEQNTGTYDVPVFLWNYAELDETTRYSKNINYEISAVLTDIDGTLLSAEDVGNFTITITQILPSGSTETPKTVTLSGQNLSDTLSSLCLEHSDSGSTENQYTISFSRGWDLAENTNICVQLKAKPTLDDAENPYTDIVELGRIIGLKKSRGSTSNGWKANISEYSDTYPPSDYDAYNLILNGSGKSTITITWDTSKLEINKYFYTYDENGNNFYGFYSNNSTSYKEVDYQEPAEGSTWATITINADTSKAEQNNRNRYTIQLYKLGLFNGASEPTGWDFYALNQTAADSPNAWIRVIIP